MSISISNTPIHLQDGIRVDREYLKSQGNQNEDRKVFHRDSLEVSQLSKNREILMDKIKHTVVQSATSFSDMRAGILNGVREEKGQYGYSDAVNACGLSYARLYSEIEQRHENEQYYKADGTSLTKEEEIEWLDIQYEQEVAWQKSCARIAAQRQAFLEKIPEIQTKEIEELQETAWTYYERAGAVTVQARFPLQEVDKEGNHKEEMYLIAVDKDGIRCSKPGQNKYEWEILFTDESQYENATEFLNYAGEFMDNFLFAAHENFWEDYLNGNMDVDAFKEFLEGTNNGIPDYSFTVGDSMYIDREKVQWAQYMNPFGAKFYTAEEMAQMQAELIEKNTATLHKLSDPYSILYKKLHPEYNGERIFCEYPGGPLYTADEIMEIMNRNLKDAKYQAEARK